MKVFGLYTGGATVAVDVDDYAAFLARFDSGALGTFEVSRVASGRGNHMQLDIYGSAGSLSFDWERNNELHYFSGSDRPDQQGFRRIVAGPAFPVFPAPIPVSGLGVGFLETMVVQLAQFALAIAGEGSSDAAMFQDGFRVCSIIDSVLQSATKQSWVEVPKRR